MEKSDTISPVEQQEMFDRYVVPEIALLLRVARSLTDQPADAEDLVQDTLLRAYRGIGQFDGHFPRAWLFKILRNTHISTVRRHTPMPIPDTGDRQEGFGEPVRHSSPETAVIDDTFDDAVEQALGRLRRPNWKVVELVDIEGLSYAEAAVALDVPIGTVVSRLHRSRKQIRDHLAEQGIDRRNNTR